MLAKKQSPSVTVLSGAIAGGVEATAVWPMEYIKTQLQLHSKSKIPSQPKLPYTGMLSGLRYHIQMGGFFSVYRGLSPVLLGSIPKAGIRFGGFAYFKELFSKDGTTSPIGNLTAGMLAGAIEATVAVTPMETIKTRLIDGNAGIAKGIQSILAREGIGGLYKGLTATILKQGSNQGLRFMWFTEYKNHIPGFLEQQGIVASYKDLNEGQLAIVNLVGGMSAGCFSTFGNNPFDVVKTRMQGLGASKYKNTMDCVLQIFRNEGISAFYAGVVPRLGRVVPGQGIIFMSYETICSFVASIIE